MDENTFTYHRKIYARYWKMVIQRAFSKAWVQIGGFFAIIIPTGIAIWQSLQAKPFVSVSELFGRQDMMGVVIFLIAAFLLVVFLISLEPVRIHKEQGGFVENPFEITKLSIDFSPKDTPYATIKVINTSQIARIDNCYLELTVIIDLTNGGSLPFETQKLSWSGKEDKAQQSLINEPITLRYDSPVWCEIASAKNNKATYLTWYGVGSEHMKIKPGNYRLTIKARGEWQGHEICYPFSLDLSYQIDNGDKFIIDSIEEVQRVK